MKKIHLPLDDEGLLAQCDVTVFRSSGPGGQHVNTTDSAVRLQHRASGLIVVSRKHRSQHRNKATCVTRLREKVAALNHRDAPRIATRMSKGARNRIREKKARASQKKQMRRKPGKDD
jgi:protein subunit release factor B